MLSCIIEPVVSCVETILVGRLGTVYLAALGPGGQLFNVVAEFAASGATSICGVVSRTAVRGCAPLLSLTPPEAEGGPSGQSICVQTLVWLPAAVWHGSSVR